jgi:hypothetical protein
MLHHGGERQAMSAPDKLSRLLQLADQGPALRAALAEEVAELLSCWPADYPESMREICEALLAKTARDVDAPTRAKLRIQLCSQPGLSRRVLPRDPASGTLIRAARAGRNLAAVLAESLGVDERTGHDILQDESGTKLAVACKAACMDRCVFSALALLTHPSRDRSHAFVMLDMFDHVPAGEAGRRLRSLQGLDQRLSA